MEHRPAPDVVVVPVQPGAVRPPPVGSRPRDELDEVREVRSGAHGA